MGVGHCAGCGCSCRGARSRLVARRDAKDPRRVAVVVHRRRGLPDRAHPAKIAAAAVVPRCGLRRRLSGQSRCHHPGQLHPVLPPVRRRSPAHPCIGHSRHRATTRSASCADRVVARGGSCGPADSPSARRQLDSGACAAWSPREQMEPLLVACCAPARASGVAVSTVALAGRCCQPRSSGTPCAAAPREPLDGCSRRDGAARGISAPREHHRRNRREPDVCESECSRLYDRVGA